MIIINQEQLALLYKMNVAAYSGKPFQGTEYKFVNSKDNNGYYGSAHVNQEKKLIILIHLLLKAPPIRMRIPPK